MEAIKEKTLGLTTQTWRRISQFFFLFAINPFVWRLIPGMGAPAVAGVCAPVMNCWSCPAAGLSCPVGAVGQLLSRGVFPFLAVGVMIFAGVLLGRLFCGWICPFGLLQDLMHKIPSRWKTRPPHSLRHLKYALLAVTVVLIPLFFGVEAGWDKASGYFYCSFCPAGTLEASIPINIQLAFDGTKTWGGMIGGLLGSIKFWILVAFLVSFVYVQRPFCKIACPIGAFLGLFNKFSLFPYGRHRKDCAKCKACADVCPEIPDVDIQSEPADCIRCYACSPAPCQSSWEVETNLAACKQCALCYELCPSGAIERATDGRPVVVAPEKCTGCGLCQKRCPELGIKIREACGEVETAGACAEGSGGEGS